MSDVKNMKLASVEEAIEDIKNGKMVIVVDDEDRENEGDLVGAGELVTPEMITFMAIHARGLICTPVSPEIAERLNFHSMVHDKDPGTCNFAVSVDAKEGIETGISALDRTTTIKKILDPNTTPQDFVRPGHVFPLRAKKGGILVRAGHTEASLDLCEAAGFKKIAVICEIMNNDGTMARLPDLLRFGDKHKLKTISIADFIAYKTKQQSLVEETADALLPTEFGDFTIRVFKETHTGREHSVLMCGKISDKNPPLVRVHSESLTGDVFGSLRCDCGEELHQSMRMIAKEGSGVLLRMNAHEGRGIGLEAKIKAYKLQDKEGIDTVEANHRLGFKDDLRHYGIGAQILKSLGIHKMKLLTNNPRKIVGLSGYGLEVVDQVPISIEPSERKKKYLKSQKKKKGDAF